MREQAVLADASARRPGPGELGAAGNRLLLAVDDGAESRLREPSAQVDCRRWNVEVEEHEVGGVAHAPNEDSFGQAQQVRGFVVARRRLTQVGPLRVESVQPVLVERRPRTEAPLALECRAAAQVAVDCAAFAGCRCEPRVTAAAVVAFVDQLRAVATSPDALRVR